MLFSESAKFLFCLQNTCMFLFLINIAKSTLNIAYRLKYKVLVLFSIYVYSLASETEKQVWFSVDKQESMTIDGQVSQYSVNGPIFFITESLHLSYIIGAVCGGVAVLLFIAGACILYHRFKSSDNGINTCLFAAEMLLFSV